MRHVRRPQAPFSFCFPAVQCTTRNAPIAHPLFFSLYLLPFSVVESLSCSQTARLRHWLTVNARQSIVRAIVHRLHEVILTSLPMYTRAQDKNWQSTRRAPPCNNLCCAPFFHSFRSDAAHETRTEGANAASNGRECSAVELASGIDHMQ